VSAFLEELNVLDPLHIVPSEMRAQVFKRYDLYVIERCVWKELGVDGCCYFFISLFLCYFNLVREIINLSFYTAILVLCHFQNNIC